jgi:hypothetical protein
MARAGRKRKEGERYPAGQIRPAEEGPSPAAIKRLRSAAILGMADPQWGSVAGLCYLQKMIDDIEYEAAKRFGDLHAQYIGVIGGPRAPKTSTGERPTRAAEIDVDTEQGDREAKRHITVMTRYNDAHTALLMVSPATEADLIRFCAMPGESPTGYEGMVRVRSGLRTLAALWKITK